MGIRESINKHPRVAAGIGGAGLVLLVAVFYSSHHELSVKVSQMFYSTDDGKTYFADDVDRIYPFDHDGKPAYRVYVYQGSGAPFVGYIARYSDAAKKRMDALVGKTDPNSVAELAAMRGSSIEVRRPNQSQWYSPNSSAGMAITSMKAPDGGALKGINP